MLENLTWTEVPLSKLRLPPEELLPLISPPDEYVCRKSLVGPKDLNTLSPEGARLLARLHPIIAWTNNYYCVGGFRTLTLITPYLHAHELIPVGLLLKASEEDIKTLVQADSLLTTLAFATKKPAATIFNQSKTLSKKELRSLSPALAGGVETCAELLEVSPPTLYTKKPQS